MFVLSYRSTKIVHSLLFLSLSGGCDAPIPLIHIKVRRRKPLADTGREWDGNFVGAVREAIAARFDPAARPIGLGGVFLVTAGKINLHINVCDSPS